MAAQPVFLVYKCLYSPHELKQKHTDCGQTVPTTKQSVVDFIFSVSGEVWFPVGFGASDSECGGCWTLAHMSKFAFKPNPLANFVWGGFLFVCLLACFILVSISGTQTAY